MSDIATRLATALGATYELGHHLGEGGMASVYRAHDRKHGRDVAIKVLKPELAAVLGAERFLREIKVMAQLTHPNILPVLDSGEADGLLYYVMPLATGHSLRDRLDQGALSIEDAVAFITEAADAIGMAHRRGVVHRDIKPENILLVEGHAVIADFGIAAVTGGADDAHLTATGISIGTPLYMSPEQASGDAVAAPSDVYSLGCTLFECLAGDPPFTGSSPAAIVSQHLTADPPDLSQKRQSVPDGVQAVVTRSLAKNPADRFTDASALAHALKGAATTTSSVATTAPQRKWSTMVGLAAVVAVVALGGWLIGFRSADRSAAIDVESLAVFPFSVRSPDPEHAYLGDAFAELLSTVLDGAGGMRSVDPGVVIAQGAAEDAHAAAARTLGAGRYVSGSVTAAGQGRVRVRAFLYNVDDTTRISAEATGTPDDLMQLVANLGRDFLVEQAVAAAHIDSVALALTDSVNALKAYLRGLEHYRASEYEAAHAALARAVAIDSTFAIAYLHQIFAASWMENEALVAAAMDVGLRISERQSVPTRFRRLLRLADAYVRGDGPAVEARAREILQEYPAEIEALVLLGEIRVHTGPFYGVPYTTAREPFERAYRLDPDRGDIRFHLANEIAFGQRDLALLDTLIVRDGLVPEEQLEHRTLSAYIDGDSAAIATAIQESDASFMQTVRVGYFLGDLRAGELLFGNAARAADPVLVAHRSRNAAMFAAGQGRLAAARAIAAAADGPVPVQAEEIRAYLAALPFLEVEHDQLRQAIDRIGQVNVRAAVRCTVTRNFVCAHDDVHHVIHAYLLGALHVKAGDRDRAESQADLLDTLSGTEPARALSRDLALGIRASIATEEGRLADALAFLEATSTVRDVSRVRDSEYFGLNAERYRQADLLAQLGRTDEALRRFESLELYPAFRAATHLRRGEIFESLGETDSAVVHYSRFVDLWQDADPEYQTLVEDVRTRLARLAGEN